LLEEEQRCTLECEQLHEIWIQSFWDEPLDHDVHSIWEEKVEGLASD